jgi:hypothetical protein
MPHPAATRRSLSRLCSLDDLYLGMTATEHRTRPAFIPAGGTTGGRSDGSPGVDASVGTVARGSPAALDGRLVYTVEEAAALLNIGRTKAYKLARQYLASGGRQGLPVFWLGGCLRVPAWALWELARYGRVVNLFELAPGERVPSGRSPSRKVTVAASRVRSGATRPRRSPDVGSRRRPAPSSGGRRAGSVEQLRLLQGD